MTEPTIDGSDATLGNLTVFAPGDHENILSMEKFDGMLTSVECTSKGMTLKFEDDSTFAHAQRVWDWVNGKDNHTFLMVAGKGDCGDNPHRMLYLVSSITYDEESNVARLKATRGSWKELAHSYELHVGSIPNAGDLGLQRRDYTKDASIDLAHDLSFKAEVKTGPVFGELVCQPCFTAGKINFEFVIKSKFKIPTGFKFRMSPSGVKVRAAIQMDLASNFGTEEDLGPKFPFGPPIPLAGVSIPGGILSIGPVLQAFLGAEVTKFEGAVSLAVGATASLPDSAVVQADLLSPSNNEFSSWIPTIETDEPTMQAKISYYVKAYLEPQLKLQAEALGKILSYPVL